MSQNRGFSPLPGEGNSFGSLWRDVCTCVCCVRGFFCFSFMGVGWVATLRLNGWAGDASFCRLGHWLCHSTCSLSECFFQRRNLIIISESETSCVLLLATSGCLSYVSHGNTAQQPHRRCQEVKVEHGQSSRGGKMQKKLGFGDLCPL